jgi:hypothetical protein
MIELPHIHFGSPEKPLDWRAAKVDGRDDDKLRIMEDSDRRLLKVDPIKLFDHHGDPDKFVEKAAFRDPWAAIQKAHPDKKIIHDPDASPQKSGPTWHFDKQFKPVIHLDRADVEARNKHQSKEKFNRYFHHPFFGVIPHEHEEGNTTLKMMQGKHDEVRAKYPKYDPKIKIRGRPAFDQFEDVNKRSPPRSLKQWKELREKSPQEFENSVSDHGGLAHDIITSPNRKAYDKFNAQEWHTPISPRKRAKFNFEKAGERDDSKFHYQMMLRPASFSTLPSGVKWDYAELPRDSNINRPDLKRGNTPHGIVKVDRRLTPDECHRFDLKEIASKKPDFDRDIVAFGTPKGSKWYDHPIQPGLKKNPKQCTQEAMREHHASGAEVHVGLAIPKEGYERGKEWYLRTGNDPGGIGSFPHAWNIKDGKLVDHALGSKSAAEHKYFGIRVPDNKLKTMTPDGLARWHTSKLHFDDTASVNRYDQFRWLREKMLDMGIRMNNHEFSNIRIGNKTYNSLTEATVAMLKACQQAGIEVPDWVKNRPDDLK